MVSTYPIDNAINQIRETGSVNKKNKVLAVIEMNSETKIGRNVKLNLTEMLITSMSKVKGYELVERSKLEKIVNEQKLQLTGVMDENNAVEIGKLLGAEVLVLGAISSATDTETDKFAYTSVDIEVGVDVRLVDVTTGKILQSESSIGNHSEKIVVSSRGTVISGALDYNIAYSKATRKAIESIIPKFSGNSEFVMGMIISYENEDELTIDLGTVNGCKVGDRFIVFSVGEEILHPVTKKQMGWKKTLIGEIEISKVEQQFSNAVVEDLMDDIIPKVGDFVIKMPAN